MNLKQIIILIIALIGSVLILWYELPIEFPWLFNILMLFVELSVVFALTAFAYIFAGKKKSSRL